MTITTKDLAKEMIRVANLSVDNGEMTRREAADVLEAGSKLFGNNAHYRHMILDEADALRLSN
jgi:hypothetical protein